MIPTWLIVALIAEVLWVGGNLLDKYLIERYFRTDEKDEGGVGTLLLFSAFFSFIIALFIFLYAPQEILFSGTAPVWGIFVGLLNALWVLLYLYAIERTELSRTVPLLQLVPVFGLILAFLILGELITPFQMFSAALVIVGAVILSYYTKGVEKKLDVTGILYMGGASVVIALTDVLFKDVAITSNFWNTAFWMNVGLGLFGIGIFAFVPKYRRQFSGFVMQKNYRVFFVNVVNEILDGGANLIFAFATLLGPIALVETTNAYQPFLILIASIFVSKLIPNYYDEDIEKTTLTQKVLGIGIITIGSVLIYSTL